MGRFLNPPATAAPALVAALVLLTEYALATRPILMPVAGHILDLAAIKAVLRHQMDSKQPEEHFQMDSDHLGLSHHHLLQMGSIAERSPVATAAIVSCLVADNSSSLSCCNLIQRVIII